MSNIKIRGWDTRDKKMIYPESQELILVSTLDFWGLAKHYKDKKRCGFDESLFDWADFDLMSERYIAMLYTGFKDKNGKESYFDDIGKDINGIFVIEWYKGTTIRKYKNESPDKMNWIALGTGLSFEIIGDKYRNSELLKELK